jgi:hypothetical protein
MMELGGWGSAGLIFDTGMDTNIFKDTHIKVYGSSNHLPLQAVLK